MTKKEFCNEVQGLVKEVRMEVAISQQQMADSIGVSKKTYIQLEKGRTAIKWSETVALCVLYKDTNVLFDHFGEDLIDIIQAVSMQKIPKRQFSTLGGTVWWNSIKKEGGFTLQQHKISSHYRILDDENYRVYFTMSRDAVEREFVRYIGNEKKVNR